jgi:hypothetical protein
MVTVLSGHCDATDSLLTFALSHVGQQMAVQSEGLTLTHFKFYLFSFRRRVVRHKCNIFSQALRLSAWQRMKNKLCVNLIFKLVPIAGSFYFMHSNGIMWIVV